MKLMRYRGGGFVIHSITGKWKGKASAWFDCDGVLMDAEQYPQMGGPSRPVKRKGPMWLYFELLGARHINTPC